MGLQWLGPFCDWLEATSISRILHTSGWLVPTLQMIHAAAVSCVVTAAVMIDLRLLGVGGRGRPVIAVARHFLPFIWWPLPVLLATGALLVAADPARALQNPLFLVKMALLLLAVGVTLASQVPLHRNSAFWDLSIGRRRAARVMALASIPLWAGIGCAGDWIAYIQG